MGETERKSSGGSRAREGAMISGNKVWINMDTSLHNPPDFVWFHPIYCVCVCVCVCVCPELSPTPCQTETQTAALHDGPRTEKGGGAAMWPCVYSVPTSHCYWLGATCLCPKVDTKKTSWTRQNINQKEQAEGRVSSEIHSHIALVACKWLLREKLFFLWVFNLFLWDLLHIMPLKLAFCTFNICFCYYYRCFLLSKTWVQPQGITLAGNKIW